MLSRRLWTQWGRGHRSIVDEPPRRLMSRWSITQTIGAADKKRVIYEYKNGYISKKKEQESEMNLKSLVGLGYAKTLNTFVPKGFPHSVSANYGSYATGHFISSIFSSAGGVLSMQALLHGVGLGAGAIPLAAALNWVIKDGLGQLGGVLFASFVNNKFDTDPKKWRLFAAVSMEISSFMEFLTPLCPQYFLPIASVANVGKNISFLAASASRAAIHNTFAVNENLADVTAKAGSQSILASTVGTGLGIGIASMLGHHYESSLLAFIACSSVGLISLRHCLRNVTLHALSPLKLMYIYASYRLDSMSSENEKCLKVLSPAQIAAVEAKNVVFDLKYEQIVSDIINHEQFTPSKNKKKEDMRIVTCPLTIGSDFGVVFPESYVDVSVCI